MSKFETVLIVDWSGGNDRGESPKKDSIWAAAYTEGVAQDPVYLRNRQVAETWLAGFFKTELAAGRRVLAGFDFPFGYPKGFARELTGSDDPIDLWNWFESRITDTPDHNNRFEVAGQINQQTGAGRGPFWFNTQKADVEGLPRNKQEGYVNPFAERRQAERRAKGAFTCWQMGGAGAVGGQVFMGLPVLSRLRRAFDASVWPFEKPDKPIAFVEVWPSLTAGSAPDGMIKDAWQVTEVARQIASLEPGKLAAMLDVDAPEEGWIFGLGHEEDLGGQTGKRLSNDCFALPPGVHWTPVDEALALLRGRLEPVTTTETVTLDAALGRIAAADVIAKRSNPPLPNSAVDGYGFAGERGDGSHKLPLMDGRAAAGDAPAHVPPGSAIRVLTGAALPSGVDSVVLQEDVTLVAGHVHFDGPVKQGANCRKAGEDVVAGTPVIHQGRRIRPPDLAILAATGTAEIEVRQALRVGVLSTGNELVEAGGTAGDGQIFDANRPLLLSAVSSFGHTAVDLGRVADDRDALRARLDGAAPEVDIILTSGGASAGDEDHVSALLTEAGAMTLWRIAIKPGRPLALGFWQGTPVFGLPGNPVAALVCTLIFARPAMAVLAGAAWSEPVGFEVPAAFSKQKKSGRREFLRARIRNGQAEAFASEGSGRISGLSWAEGLVELPDHALTVAPGDLVRFIPYASFGL